MEPPENHEALLAEELPLPVTKLRLDVETQINEDNSEISIVENLRLQNQEVSLKTGVNKTSNEELTKKCSFQSIVEEKFATDEYYNAKPLLASRSSKASVPGSLTSAIARSELTDRSDSSDSGLGSELMQERVNGDHTAAHAVLTKIESESNSITLYEASENNYETFMPFAATEKEFKADIENAVEFPSLRSSLKRRNMKEIALGSQKKFKREIQFDNVTVYYFPRAQGFSCIPSQGGSTLGMDRKHSHVHTFTLNEHAAEQRRIHRQILHQIRCERQSLQRAVETSSDESETEEEPSDISESELDLDNYYFLQPVTTKQRRVLLRNSGVKKIETSEKNECRDIRTSREFCGCGCKGFCDPETCSCSLAGIKCQVDRLNFPCGCSHDGCGNTTGRIEFNPVRVRTHFIHTLMKLGLEKKSENMMHAEGQWLDPADSSKKIHSFQIEQSHTVENGLLRDVNLTPRVEVETCVDTANFSSVHFDLTNRTREHFPQQDEQLNQHNMYSFHRSDNYLENRRNLNVRNFNQTTQVNPYTSNLIIEKNPCTLPGLTYNHTTNTTHNFQCDPNFPYLHQGEPNQYNKAQSYSAASFDEFAHSAHMSMFSHYNQNMYISDYLPKTTGIIQEQSQAMQYNNVSSLTYNSYKNSTGAQNIECRDEQFGVSNALYNINNSLETLPENEETQFMENVLDKNDASGHTASTGRETQSAQRPPGTDSESCDNFGEIIKKTMVESVSV